MSIEVISRRALLSDTFDVFVFTAGYETRSLHLLPTIGPKASIRICYIFDNQDPASRRNREAAAQSMECSFVHKGERLASIARDALCEVTDRPVRVAVDISSMSRGVMASVFAQLFDDEAFAAAEIAVFYSVAKFSPPAIEPPDLVDFGPIPEFSGWTTAPEKPVVMILGLGYEPDQAIGAVEYLDPSATFAFDSEGIDERFRTEVDNANEPLLEMLKDERRILYPVMDPFATYWQLRSLIMSLTSSARMVLAPMGPKIFVSLCLACQREFGEEISVWRSSSHSPTEVKDVEAAGPVFGYSIRRTQ